MNKELEYCPFVIDETPYAFWDYDIKELNLNFINSIDPKYFQHFAEVHGNLLETQNRQYAAVAMRSAYAHGLETLFALIASSMQSPQCVIGWMLKYKSSELFKLTRKIDMRQPVLNRTNSNYLSWDIITEVLLSHFSTGDQEKDKEILYNFSKLWRRFAKDFLDEDYSKEYNSVKHGLRVGMGGFTLAIGPEDIPGIPCPPERMKSLGGSVFGTEFYTPTDLVDKVNFRTKRKSLNWSPENLICGLQLISLSIGNVVSGIKILNGIPADQVNFQFSSNSEDYDGPWKIHMSTQKFEMNSALLPEWIEPISKQEIKNSYSIDQSSKNLTETEETSKN